MKICKNTLFQFEGNMQIFMTKIGFIEKRQGKQGEILTAVSATATICMAP